MSRLCNIILHNHECLSKIQSNNLNANFFRHNLINENVHIAIKTLLNPFPIIFYRNLLENDNIRYCRRHRGGKVANKMRVLEKRKRREQEKLGKMSQNTLEFIKLSPDVNK